MIKSNRILKILANIILVLVLYSFFTFGIGFLVKLMQVLQ